MNKTEHNKIVDSLPEFSRQVYDWLINDGLYAEPGFSDVTAKDIADGIKQPVNRVKGALSHLHESGLTFTEEWEGNGTTQEFIHATAHSNGLID